jgi:hypothetical protein
MDLLMDTDPITTELDIQDTDHTVVTVPTVLDTVVTDLDTMELDTVPTVLDTVDPFTDLDTMELELDTEVTEVTEVTEDTTDQPTLSRLSDHIYSIIYSLSFSIYRKQTFY